MNSIVCLSIIIVIIIIIIAVFTILISQNSYNKRENFASCSASFRSKHEFPGSHCCSRGVTARLGLCNSKCANSEQIADLTTSLQNTLYGKCCVYGVTKNKLKCKSCVHNGSYTTTYNTYWNDFKCTYNYTSYTNKYKTN